MGIALAVQILAKAIDRIASSGGDRATIAIYRLRYYNVGTVPEDVGEIHGRREYFGAILQARAS